MILFSVIKSEIRLFFKDGINNNTGLQINTTHCIDVYATGGGISKSLALAHREFDNKDGFSFEGVAV